MPILSFDSLDMVPEGLREHAKKAADSDQVTVNVVSAQAVDQFRDNNIRLSKERDDLLAERDTLKGLVGDDAEAFKTELDTLRLTGQRVKDGELKESRDIEEAAAKRTEEMRKQYDERLQQETKAKLAYQRQHEELEARFRRSQIAAAIQAEAMLPTSGVEPAAIGDVITNAYDVFRVTDPNTGTIGAHSGDAPIYGADGVTPMGAKEWLGKLKEAKPYLFKQSGGGGAGSESTTGKKVGDTGYTREQLKSMSATERLAAINGDKPARL